MSTIIRFEDLECWQTGRMFRREVYRLSRLPAFARDFALVDQIRRAVISVGSNIAEGFERGGSREFVQFLSQAKGSAGEAKDQLYVALDEAYVTPEEFNHAYALGESTCRLIGGFMTYLRKSTVPGFKFDCALARGNPRPKTQNPRP